MYAHRTMQWITFAGCKLQLLSSSKVPEHGLRTHVVNSSYIAPNDSVQEKSMLHMLCATYVYRNAYIYGRVPKLRRHFGGRYVNGVSFLGAWGIVLQPPWPNRTPHTHATLTYVSFRTYGGIVCNSIYGGIVSGVSFATA